MQFFSSRSIRIALSALAVVWISCAVGIAKQFVATPKNANGIYSIGELIQWDVSVQGEGAEKIQSLRFVIKRFGLTVIEEGTLDLVDGKATLSAVMNAPGTLLVELRPPVGVQLTQPTGGQARGGRGRGGQQAAKLVGAVVAPEKIKPSSERPEDFDAFWANKIEQLNSIPMNPRLEQGVPYTDAEKTDPDKAAFVDALTDNVGFFKVQLDHINGSQIYGQLAKPMAAGKYPAMLLVQYASVEGLPKVNVVKRAQQGWLALNIMPHDLPFDQPASFYSQARSTTHSGYTSMGNDNRDESYFLRMYLSCYRAIEYLSQRDDWDGKTIVVLGDSMGGQQSIVTAGLNPKVTAMLALVPAGCDVTGPSIGRAAGYPDWARTATSRDNPKILETGRYFDSVNFASRIKCPSLIAMGLIDETCPPAGVLAACNEIKSPLEILVLVNSPHQNQNNSQVPYQLRREVWLSAMVKGETIPVLPLKVNTP